MTKRSIASTPIRDELRSKMPGTAKLALTSAKMSIRLFCIECMGGMRKDALDCAEHDCFLWLHRGSTWTPEAREKARLAASGKQQERLQEHTK